MNIHHHQPADSNQPLPDSDLRSIILRPLSYLYSGAIYLRNHGYDWGYCDITKLAKPVISVGNITAGGSGKTPLVRFICEELLKKNLKLAVLTRGYRRKSKDNIFFESPPAKHLIPDDIGDEPLMLARQLPGVIFGISADRKLMAERIIRAYNPDVFILDDGFQHRKVHRDIDIVVLDAARPFDNGHCLPAGLLREPITSLSRAGIIIIRTQKGTTPQAGLPERIKSIAPKAEIIEASIVPKKLESLSGIDTKPIEFLRGRKVIAFCGIGNPDGFRMMLSELGADIRGFRAFRDHHRYSEKNLHEIGRQFSKADAEICVTTMKDGVKLTNDKFDFPLFLLDIGYEIGAGDRERFLSFVIGVISADMAIIL